ncbi:hypothetical protein [Pseudolactococcus paracarnosus]|uniref:Lipoprotein n=1 Tax=Pseudolactococcus paracarnosus TaxID=2749962 RepID=A0ABT0AJ57_9LACT|nr:hypothetical protein [Lactococcus paracarnosus]SPC35924.1 exported hypothetical protein [Lactococcus piscium]MCJ1976572.1 hypothetical protein [Lactococcus paracarnosus]MCJ1982637.1 hypothetical protein [Lactococcus paracarnosus]MCJ1993498.1 hypothetical protein [Lactococcus paracarnosus]MCJ1997583.1 hypothetical protein [Lactococcus paracarnosus]
MKKRLIFGIVLSVLLLTSCTAKTQNKLPDNQNKTVITDKNGKIVNPVQTEKSGSY